MNKKRWLVLGGFRHWFLLIFGSTILNVTTAQTTLDLHNLSAFKDPGTNWGIAGNVMGDPGKDNSLDVISGIGILVNIPNNNSKDLFTNFQHGDLDLSLDFMMAKGSNSGIYLQGRYEVQLLDSWRQKSPTSGDNGGIYERWDENRGKGNEGFDGYPPRQNASRAPGLWQHLEIAFQAPRFDASGNKIENAVMLKVELNGVAIHENVELTGPTRGAISNDEVAMGALRLQGDHGAVAFRNIKYTNYDKPRPQFGGISYRVYKGKFEKEPDFAKLTSNTEGKTLVITPDVNKIDNEFLIRYSGTITVHEPGTHHFKIYAPGGGGYVKINNKTVISYTESDTGIIVLQKGNWPFELGYSKIVSYIKPALGLSVSGPGFREYLVTDANTSVNEVVDPIFIDAPVNTTLRSFMDMPDGRRVVHAVNVGSPKMIHYTYDLDNGMILQAWRGRFLDATPMWHDRGDGSSRAVGAVLNFGSPNFTIRKLPSPGENWNNDTTGTQFRIKGYVLDDTDQPTFRYNMYGAEILDAIRLMDNEQGLKRTITLNNTSRNWYVRLAEGKIIEVLPGNRYLIEDKAYYLQVDDAAGATPTIRDGANGIKELIIPIDKTISYSIIF